VITRSERTKVMEGRNSFDMRADFLALYKSRNNPDFPYKNNCQEDEEKEQNGNATPSDQTHDDVTTEEAIEPISNDDSVANGVEKAPLGIRNSSKSSFKGSMSGISDIGRIEEHEDEDQSGDEVEDVDRSAQEVIATNTESIENAELTPNPGANQTAADGSDDKEAGNDSGRLTASTSSAASLMATEELSSTEERPTNSDETELVNEARSVDTDNFESRFESADRPREGVIHFGCNAIKEEKHSLLDEQKEGERPISSRGLKSPLFVWIVILIVIPLLLTTVLISAVVLVRVSDELDDSVDDSEDYYFGVEKQGITISAKLRADFVSSSTARPLRDLYIMTRYGGWLLFDGLQRTNLFREGLCGVDECKDTGSFNCDWAVEKRVCDCDWNYETDECKIYPPGASRSLQVPYYFVSSDKADESGARGGTNYPDGHYSPASTTWWNTSNLPGLIKGDNASGYETTYDRARVALASPLFAALHNYDKNKEVGSGHFFAFEEDGLLVASEGCGNSEHGWAAFWQSSEDNGGAKFRPELCPVGRYGYDPRCREWYATGKSKAMEGKAVYATPPYAFSQGTLVAQSATSALTDPRSGEHVGQVLIDFSADSIFSKLATSNTYVGDGGFVLMITLDADQFGGDTIIGPGVSGTSDGLAVSEAVIPYDINCASTTCKNRVNEFSNIVKSMKNGEKGTTEFVRTTADGGSEHLVISYAPSETRFLEATDASDFARGAVPVNEKIYSVGLVETRDSIFEPFDEAEDDMSRQLNASIAVLSCFVFAAVVLAVFVSYRVARSISEPMLYLLEMIRCINNLEVDQEPPSIDRTKGSKEILYVSNTIHSLYRAVRLANAFFNAGELEAAYYLLVDVLSLFKRLGNKKAIGVAYNNLGNTIFALHREMKQEKAFVKCGLTMDELIKKGTSCYNEAIRLGEKAYDEFYDKEGWTPNCLDFMQHLSNRYFNRAMFLLQVKDDHGKCNELEQLGIRDLEIARDMDNEVIAYGEEIGWNSADRAEAVFNVGLVRIRGHILLVEMGFADAWDIDEKIADLYQLLTDESSKLNSELFREITYAGRLQELEAEMMRYALVKKDIKLAAQLAIRPLLEDEYVFLPTEIQAVVSLMAYVESSELDLDTSSRAVLRHHLKELGQNLKNEKMRVDSVCSGGVKSENVSASMANVFSASFEFTSDRSASAAETRLASQALEPDKAFFTNQVVIMEQF